ncbi:MerR family transcriptional regulator [Paeniglutamicibacter kerguelensis]|uniref:DNA-binding transcriptional MerR regulator n=1 Tax=Paeniglutamicibacter kerguelensis TaxID=254788 RepID=A0ABS4XIL4_9MICC|nr:MerR family transcriptional regulator [Paeniglutamicibacter kerguelensis]MBP2388201.1 DNA-binding transcriptional MerR regulator [Paeniglutamicibacter kerguelensis]
MNRENLLGIGAFAESTMLSPKALRIYDERGLLVPVLVDQFSGYRYYAREQSSQGRIISMLRAAAMPLDAIAAFMATVSDSPEEALDQLLEHEAAVRNNTDAISTLLAQVRAHLTGNPMENVTSILEPERHLLSVMLRCTVRDLDEGIENRLERLHAMARDNGLNVVGPPFGIFHREITEDSDGPLEVCLPVDSITELSPDQAADPVRSYRLAGGRYASVTVSGPETDFPAILAAYDQVCGWIEKAGGTRVGPPHEIWHVLPWAAEPTEMTIAWPFA